MTERPDYGDATPEDLARALLQAPPEPEDGEVEPGDCESASRQPGAERGAETKPILFIPPSRQ